MAVPVPNNGSATPAAKNAERVINTATVKDMTAAGILEESLAELGVDGSEPAEPANPEIDDEDEIETDADETAAPPGADSDGEKDEDEEEEETDADGADESAAEAAGDVEEITANGEVVKIDYSDKKAIKRAHEKAAGVDKLFGRYKEVRDENKALKSAAETRGEADKQTAETVALYKTLTDAFGEGGVEGTRRLMDRLTGGKAKEFAKQIAAQADAPAPTADQVAETHRTEAAKLREEVAALKDETRLGRAQAAIDGVWPQFSLVGKLGNPASEQAMDEFMFTKMQAAIATEEKRGTTITSDVVTAIMTGVSKLLPQAIHQEARRMQTAGSGKAAKAAKAAAQKAAIGSKTGSGKGTQKTVDDSKVNWLNPSEVTNFLEASLNNRG